MTPLRAARRVAGFAVLAVLSVLAGCQGTPRPPGGPFTYDVDPALTPSPASVDDPVKGVRPLAASRDGNGTVSVFFEDEIVLSDVSAAELSAFLAAHGGTVLEDDSVPTPPAGLNVVLTAAQAAARSYTIRVDPATIPLDTFASDAEAAGFGGPRTFSSEASARLMALMVAELRAGAKATPNYLYEAHEPLVTTDEAGSLDAFTWPNLHMGAGMADGSKSGVLKAWQLLTAHGYATGVGVAIIDGGFWLDGSGMPGSSVASGASDLPTAYAPYQYDFISDDYTAGGTNPATCTGGNPCPWHGNGSAGVAAGRMNNDYGSVGTGAPVAEPFLFKVDLSTSEVERAIRTAQVWGARVVSMSFGGSCNLDCWSFMSKAFRSAYEAQQAGVVLVASAGNDNKKVDDDPVFPCMIAPVFGQPGAICVGALDDGAATRIKYSNYGSSVDIFAPTDIPAMPDPTTGGGLAVHSGTSASAPFVAGVVALMEAADPTLTPSDVDGILKSTAWTDSPDGRVPRYLNAYEAVRSAIGATLPDDALEPNDSQAAAKALPLGARQGPLTIGPDSDYLSFSLADYSDLVVALDFMPGLGDVGWWFVGSGALPINPTTSARVDGADLSFGLLPPGSYEVAVLGDLNQYYVTATPNTAALAPDAFEVNDTLGTAAAPAAGAYEVTRHVAGDDDYYAFTVPTLVSGLNQYDVDVPTSDRPVTLSLYKAGALVGTWPTGTSVTVTIHDAGAYAVGITGSQRTRYTFRHGTVISKTVFPSLPVSIDKIWWIDPTGPVVSGWLVGERDGYALALSARELTAFGTLRMAGAGEHVRLYDDGGALVAEGVPEAGAGGPAELLQLSGMAADRDYLVVVERTTLPAVQGALLPVLPYELSLQ